MFPSLAELQTPGGAMPLGTYGLMITMATMAGFGVYHSSGRRMGFSTSNMVAAFAIAVAVGLLGARVLYAAAVGQASALWSCTGGFAFYGGLLGGLVGGVATGRALGMPLWKLADASAPAVVLGHGIGRLGCFFAGCCHGAVVPLANPGTPLLPESFSGGQLYAHSHAPFLTNAFSGGASRITDVPLYPTQLWLAAGSFVLFGVLMAVQSNRRFDGQVAATSLLLEPVVRTVVELFRADHRGYAISWTADPENLPIGLAQAGAQLDGPTVVGVTTSQGIAVLLVLFGAAIFAARRSAGVAHEENLDDVWVDELAG